MKKTLKILLLLLLAAALVIGAVRLVKLRKAREARTPVAKEYAVVVDTVRAEASRVRLTLPAIALTRNDLDAVLASKVSARVLSVVPSGSRVKKGELLVRLDDTALRASLESVRDAIASAKNQLEAAQLNLKHLETVHRHSAELLKIQGLSKEQFDAETVKLANARAQIEGIKAQIAKLRAEEATLSDQLSYTRIVAPTDGTVSEAMVSPGDLAMPGKALLKLSAKEGSWLLLRLPRPAKKILYRGREVALEPLHSTFNGLLEFRADVAGGLPAGNRVECDVLTFEGEAVKLPYDVLLNREGKNWVLLYEKGKIRPLPAPLLATGQEGIALDPSLSGKELIEAKPDILLRLLGGYPFVLSHRER
ncbi:efflux RND transporter periplasmic adaptor subunit [Nitratifractor sp.]